MHIPDPGPNAGSLRGKQRTLDFEEYYWMLPTVLARARTLIGQSLSATHALIISACLMDIVTLVSGQ